MMQNLPIQLTQTPILKSGVEAASKIEPVQATSNESFQNVLSKQQTKQAQTKSSSATSTNAESASKKATPAANAPASPPAQDNEESAKLKQEAEAVEESQRDMKEDAETALTQAIDPALLVQAVVTPPVLAVKQGSVDIQAEGEANGVAKSLTSLDTALSNALAQGKTLAADPAVKEANADNVRWLDAVLPAAKPAAGNDSNATPALNTTPQLSNTQQLTSAQLLAAATREVASKEADTQPQIQPLATPVAYQPAVIMSAAAVTEMPGSSNVINASPGKAGWDQAISQKVMWMVGSGEQSATLTLNPPDLGPVQVVIHVHNEQVDTTFVSNNAEVRQALENGMSTLRDKMSEAGIQLGQANVNSGSQTQQEFQQASQQGSGNQSNSGTSGPLDAIEPAQLAIRVANGLVDTFA